MKFTKDGCRAAQRAKSWSELPAQAIKFVRRIEELLETQSLFCRQVQEGKIQSGKKSFSD